jgi:predicted N-acetyltransferase YhbS
MQIDEIPLDQIDVLTDLYNAHAFNVPLSDPVSRDRFVDAEQFRCDSGSPPRASEQAVLAAFETGRPIGFIHVAIGRFPGPELRGDQEEGETGAIRFLTYPPGRRDAGQSLLKAAETYLLERKVGRLLAFSNTTGYLFRRFAFGEVSDRCPHILGLMGINGYTVARGEIFLESRNYESESPEPPDTETQITTTRTEVPGPCRSGVTVVATRGADLVGECITHSHGKWGASTESNETLIVGPLDVEEGYQGEGWGRYLMLTAMAEAAKLGYKHAVISTDWHNYRAQLFYTNYGYAALDTAYAFTKPVDTV